MTDIMPFDMTPKETVSGLDRHIVSQTDAKRAVAIALRDRKRRAELKRLAKKDNRPELLELYHEITPKNILMMGPTGSGKTEIARRLSKMANAPFLKVEATKFTEVGYVGRDVESIIRDLSEIAIKMARDKNIKKVGTLAEEAAEERILDILVPSARGELADQPKADASSDKDSATRQLYRKKFREGDLDDKEIEIDLLSNSAGMEILGPPGMEEMVGQLQSLMENMSSGKMKTRKLTIKEAFKQLTEEEASKLIDEEDIRTQAVNNVEQNGIVFIDEIDKIIRTHETRGGDVSREGVQRDLLPLVEGCNVSTKYGIIKTDHILFIASGAFHLAKPSDLIPELQGRFPIRVELKPLTAEDFKRILVEPKANLTEQYIELLKTEDFNIEFTEDGINRIAEMAEQVNTTTENIGARRLHTILEKLLAEISFDAPDRHGESIKIDKAYVDEQLKKLAEDEDLSRSIL